MFRIIPSTSIRAAAAVLCLAAILLPGANRAFGQSTIDSIVSRHVRVRIPAERQWLARDTIADLERCWQFVRGATGGKLPDRVWVVVDWTGSGAAVDEPSGSVTIGMAHPAAAGDMRGFLLRSTAREMVRLALIRLSKGAAADAGNRFLLEGMCAILANEFSGTFRRLDSAWAYSYYLDRMEPLGLHRLASRPGFSAGSRDLGSTAPGATFLIFCRETFGADGVLKLFEALAKKNQEESLGEVFRTPAAGLESDWLARVRSYTPVDVTVDGEANAPSLERVTFVPDPAPAGADLEMRVYTRDGSGDLAAGGLVVVDEASGRTLQPASAQAGAAAYYRVDIPIEAGRAPGRYLLRIVAFDNAGNVRNWEASYTITRQTFVSSIR